MSYFETRGLGYNISSILSPNKCTYIRYLIEKTVFIAFQMSKGVSALLGILEYYSNNKYLTNNISNLFVPNYKPVSYTHLTLPTIYSV